MATQIVKVYYNDEIRRFRFELGDEGHFGYKRMLVKIQHLFPDLDVNRVRMTWKDNDGESVTISSNTELKEAVRSLPAGENQVLRIQLSETNEQNRDKKSEPDQIKVDQLKEKEQSVEAEPKEKTDEDLAAEWAKVDPTLHYSVVCDGCNGQIRGIRFKCLTCSDYDLCSICTEKNQHDEHPMIRITSPKDLTWKPAFIAAQGPFPFMAPFFRGRHGPGHKHRHEHGHGHGHPPPPFPFMFPCAPGGQGPHGPRFGSGRCHGPRRCQRGEWAQKCQNQKEEEKKVHQSSEEKSEQKDEQESLITEEIIRDLGETINSVLSAIGVSIPIQTEPEQPKNTTETTPAPTTAANATPQSHPDPKIAAALNYMIAMGYSNDGGWLTKLLEEKRGDVSSVLDVLHPSARK